MECKRIKQWILRLPDDELPEDSREILESHVRQCSSCARERQLALLARRIGEALPAPDIPPWFASRVTANIRQESQGMSIWQIILILSKHFVPALAAVTLIFVSIFAYLEFGSPQTDISQVYDSLFISSDQPLLMVITDPGEITDESIFRALADEEPQQRAPAPQVQPRRD